MEAFEFINETPGQTMILGGFHIVRGPAVLQLIPALASYLSLQLVFDTLKADDLFDQFDTLLRSRIGNQGRYDRDEFRRLLPTPLLVWNPLVRIWEPRGKRSLAKLEARSALVFSAFFVMVFLAFEGQAYYILFPTHSVVSHVLWALSLLVTIVCLSISVLAIEAPSGRLLMLFLAELIVSRDSLIANAAVCC